MPIAIVVQSDGTIPAVIQEPTEQRLLDQLRWIARAHALGSISDAREWLAALPPPSGWFLSLAEAQAHVARFQRDEVMPPAELAAIRAQVGMTRVAFAKAIGYTGNDNTCHKQVWEMEEGRKPVSATKARMARALLASVALTAPNPA